MGRRFAKSRPGLIAAIDLGSTKTCCMIARPADEGGLEIIGIGCQASKGIRAGAIIDMEATELSVLNAVHAAERAAGESIHEVAVNISAGQPGSRIVSVEIPVAGSEVTDADVRHVLEAGCEIDHNETGRELIHTIPVAYSIDDNRGIRDPRGMFGEKLGVNMNVVTTGAGAVRNLSACMDRCHLEISMLAVSPIASGLSCLVEDEMDLGVTLIDLGGGTTTIAVFFDGHAVYCDMIPIGGNHVTNDIARGLSTPIAEAERLKTLHGSAIGSPRDEMEMIDVPLVGEHESGRVEKMPRSSIVEIVQPRIEETLEVARSRLAHSGFDKVAGRRVVLTGGASQLQGLREQAATILDKQVRMARPLLGVGGVFGLGEANSGPELSTCVGLLHCALGQQAESMGGSAFGSREGGGLFGRIGLWLRENL